MITARASFRDPGGRVIRWDGRILRVVGTSGEESLRCTLRSAAAQRLVEEKALVATRFLNEAERNVVLRSPVVAPLIEDMAPAAVAEHDAAPFQNYPHEWAPELLHAAGELTIEMALRLLDDGMGLKDATPFNVMFDGPRPVFLDLLSVEGRDRHDPTWTAHAQFVRTFLLPLLVNRLRRIRLDQIFTTRREGLEPEDVYPLLGPFQRLRPRVFPLVTFPAWFGNRAAGNASLYAPRRVKDPEKAEFILRSLLQGQRRALNALRPVSDAHSHWSGYADGQHNYGDEQYAAKRRFVARALSENKPASVLDIGCNTGEFSLLAAEQGARVVAVDNDPVVVGRLWRAARERRASILPLVINFAQPTPALGWDNAECRSFLDRAAGAFDAVFMLAVVHHLLVTDRLPLAEIFGMARRLTRRLLIIEYIDPADAMFRLITRGREHLHRDFSRAAFEQAAAKHFRLLDSHDVAGPNRRLYVLEALP